MNAESLIKAAKAAVTTTEAPTLARGMHVLRRQKHFTCTLSLTYRLYKLAVKTTTATTTLHQIRRLF